MAILPAVFLAVVLDIAGVAEGGGEYCMTWRARGTDADGTTFSYSLTDPFRPTFCGELPVYQETEQQQQKQQQYAGPKVLYFNYLKAAWEIGEKLPKCTKEAISETKVLFTSRLSERNMETLAGKHTWMQDGGEVDITFTCAQKAIASGAFDNFKNVEL